MILFAPSLYECLRPASPPIQVILQEWKVDSALDRLPKKGKLPPFRPGHLVAFDPNTASKDVLVQVGFSPSLANRLENYRNKGGRFRIKSDLTKLYGIPPALFEHLRDSILLPDSLPSRKPLKSFSRQNMPPAVPFTLDINKADTAAWEKVRGIGRVLSQRIVKFRDKLGGFASKEQLFEVYGLDSMVVKENWEVWTLHTPAQKILINTWTAEELAAHPYIGKKLAFILVRYRKEHGPFQSLEEVSAVKALDAQKIQKLGPYLQF